MDAFAPRDARASARALVVVLAVVSVVLAAYNVVAPPTGLSWYISWGAVLATAVGAVASAVVPDRLPVWFHVATPAAGAVAIAVLNVLSDDSSAAAQLFFLMPIVFSAAHLRPWGAWGLTVLAVTGEAVSTLMLLPVVQAVSDTVFLAGVAVTTTTLLVRANERSEALLAELHQLAAVDPVTGLATRRMLENAAACALTSADSALGTSFVLVDVDRFKSVNDVHGHPAGDHVLRVVGERLREVAGPDAVVSRLGGDELALLLPSTAVSVARLCAEAASDRLRSSPVALEDGTALTVTASMGVAHAPVHARDLVGLYRAADAALYRAKREGRDRVVVADPAGWSAAVPPLPAPGSSRAGEPGDQAAPAPFPAPRASPAEQVTVVGAGSLDSPGGPSAA